MASLSPQAESLLFVGGGEADGNLLALTESRQQATTDPEEATGALCPSSGEVVLYLTAIGLDL